MCNNFENPKMKQSEIANQLGYSTSTLQNIEMIQVSFHHIEFTQLTPMKEQKRLQILILTTIYIVTLTPNDLNRLQMRMFYLLKTKKNIVEAGSVHDKVEINEHFLDETLQNDNP